MRWRWSLLLVAMVLLAGCTVPLLDDSSDSVESYPPGVSENGAVNETKLLAEHFRAMNESVVRIDHRNGNDSSLLIRGPNRTLSRSAISGTVWSGPRRSVSNDTWGDAEYTYDYQWNVTVRDRGGGPMIFGLVIRLSSGHYEHRGTRTVDGRTLHELELVEPRGMASGVGHYTGTALVDQQGRIHRLSGAIGDSEQTADQYEYAFDWDVETVPQPSWVDAVPRIEANKSADSTTLLVSMGAGPSIPAGETLEFYHNGLEGTVELAEPLDPGETLYVGFEGTREDGRVVAARQPIDTESLRSLRGDRTSFGGTVTLEDGTVVSIELDVGRIDFES